MRLIRDDIKYNILFLFNEQYCLLKPSKKYQVKLQKILESVVNIIGLIFKILSIWS
jgi:hypothetical protein